MPALMFNKPYGVLSQFTDEGTGHPTLKEYIPVPDVYAAGRLDRDSEGLLILTDDGSLIKHLTDPEHHVQKTYWALVEGEPDPNSFRRLEDGIQLKGYKTRPAIVRSIPVPDFPDRARPVTPHGPTFWLEVRIAEGKKHQVRHMTAAVGLFTLRLIRVAVGTVQLGDLPPGKWRQMTPSEIRALGRS